MHDLLRGSQHCLMVRGAGSKTRMPASTLGFAAYQLSDFRYIV